ncbi:MAG: cytochrome c oxidase accessory protein CcoG [Campylobacteraceae bacterium]|jgi:cytochrome c oxidase accessory protein FixG|nr:cytochrome c oxidase accessory protein CcoG [Campylobacteraceae bacterium]
MRQEIAKHAPYSKKRHMLFVFITIFSLVIPWITIEGKHLFLMSFDKKQFHLLFTSFDMQELYLIPFLLIIFFLGIFFITTVGGRIWCGWGCPQTIFRYVYRDFLQTKIFRLYKSIENKQQEIEGRWFSRIGAFLVFVLFAVAAASNLMWYFIPPEDFFVYIKDPHEHKLVFVILFIFTTLVLAASAFLKEKFCAYVCPYVRIQSAMFDDDTIQTIYNERLGGEIYDKNHKKLRDKAEKDMGECIGCNACVKICPTHIDIRAGMQLECINCLECADACAKVMNRLDKPSLISWTSPNAIRKDSKVKFVRFRTVAYSVVLTIAVCALLLMSAKKERMLLDINRGSQLFSLSSDGSGVENAYTFLFQNTDSKEHEYYFEVLNGDISIILPKAPFKLRSGEKSKKIVVLNAKIGSSLRENEGRPQQIAIRAYATDDKERIFTEKEIMFFYPKTSDMSE